MLQWLRDNVKSLSWTLWLVIIAFILLYVPDFLTQQAPADTAASVGEHHISRQAFARVYRNIESRYRQALGEQFTPEVAKQFRLEQEALNQLAQQHILAEEARRMGLAVSDDELRREILRLPLFQDEQGRFVDGDTYERIVRRVLEYDKVGEFEEDFRSQLLIGKLQAVLSQNLYLSDEAVESEYRRQTERASIRYVRLPQAELAGEIEAGKANLAAYFETHQEDYRLPEQRVVSYLLLDSNRLRASIEISDEELRAYYEANPDEFARDEQVQARHILLNVNDERSDEEARAEMATIRSRLAAGEDFGALAAELSDDQGSKQQGGDLGYFGRGRMVPEFEEAAFGAAVGEVVGPVQTAFGLHLIEVLAQREAGMAPFEEVRNQIRFRLQTERSQEIAQSRATELAQRIADEGLTAADQLRSLADEAEELSFEVSQPFGETDPVPQLGRAPAFNEAAFALEIGAVSEPVQVPRGWAILRLDEVKEPRIPSLDEVADRVRQAYVGERQEALALERLEAAKAAIEAGASFDETVAGLGLEIQESGEFGRDQPIQGLGMAPSVKSAALALDAGAVGGPLALPQGAVLFQVVDRKSWDAAEFATKKAETRQALEQQEVQRLLSAVISERLTAVGGLQLTPEMRANLDQSA